MTSKELGKEVVQFLADGFMEYAAETHDRVTGIGQMQYQLEENLQKFETLTFDELFHYAEEELQDLAVYSTMLHIRLRRLRNLLTGFEAQADQS